MSTVLVTVPIFVLAEVWHHTACHCIRCPVALSGQAYFFSCGLGGGLFQAVDILHCLILAFLTLSLSMCWHQPCLFELLLLGVVVVPVDDDHAVDHVVVKLKTVAKLNVPARLNNLHSFMILRFSSWKGLKLDKGDLSSDECAIHSDWPSLLSFDPCPVFGDVHNHLMGRRK